jgi:aromatic ring-opening dioxygenase LigB subunit
MPLVFAGLAPHSPLLIPAIGGDNLNQLSQTQNGYLELEKEFYASSPETIIIISPHGEIRPDSFSLPHAPKLLATFTEFGDPATRLEFEHDLVLASSIKELGEKTNNIFLSSVETLDYGAGVPLFYLTKHLKPKVIVISHSGLDRQSHFALGTLLKTIITRSPQRIAFLASGDLSHRLSEESPAGFNANGQIFDETIINIIKEKRLKDLLIMEKQLLLDAGSDECGYRSLLVLAGLLDGINYQSEILSYEKPFGIGYLTANFILS